MARIPTPWKRDDNPFRRTADRLEEIGARVCIAVALLGIPFAVAVSVGTYRAASADAERDMAGLYRTEAVALEGTRTLGSPSGQPIEITNVRARWTGPDGRTRQAQVEVPSGTDAGDTVQMWTTAAGEPAPARSSVKSRLIAEARTTAVGLMLVIAAAAYVSNRLLRHAVDRRRLRAWDIEWASFDEHLHRYSS